MVAWLVNRGTSIGKPRASLSRTPSTAHITQGSGSTRALQLPDRWSRTQAEEALEHMEPGVHSLGLGALALQHYFVTLSESFTFSSPGPDQSSVVLHLGRG